MDSAVDSVRLRGIGTAYADSRGYPSSVALEYLGTTLGAVGALWDYVTASAGCAEFLTTPTLLEFNRGEAH